MSSCYFIQCICAYVVCHAAVDAIVNRTVSDLKECTIYVTHTPDKDCAQIIVESGIKKVVYIGGLKPNELAKIDETTKQILYVIININFLLFNRGGKPEMSKK